MNPIGRNILVEQKFVKKKGSTLILPEGVQETDVDNFDQTLTLISLGAGCPQEEVKPGDVIFINNFAQPYKVDKIEGGPKSNTVINHVIYDYEVVVGKE